MRRLVSVLMALIMVLGVVACGGSNSSTDSDQSMNGGSATGESVGSSSGASVIYWSMWESTEPQGEAIAKAATAFTEETGIKVDVQFKGRTGIREGLIPALDAGTTIDMFDEDIERGNTAFAKYTTNLEEFVTKYNYEITDIVGLIESCI